MKTMANTTVVGALIFTGMMLGQIELQRAWTRRQHFILDYRRVLFST